MNKLSLSIGILCLGGACAVYAAGPADMLGESVPAAEATSTINIMPSTRYVNVTEGDAVNFVANAHQFAFKFDGNSGGSFDLESVAPAGTLDHSVMVYVAPNQDDVGDGGN